MFGKVSKKWTQLGPLGATRLPIFSVILAFEGPGRALGGHNGAKCLQNAPKSVQNASQMEPKSTKNEPKWQ